MKPPAPLYLQTSNATLLLYYYYCCCYFYYYYDHCHYFFVFFDGSTQFPGNKKLYRKQNEL